MTSRRSVRHLVQAEIAARLVAKRDDSKVAVQDGLVVRDLKVETIGLGPVTSVDTGTRNIKAGRQMRRDLFAFKVQFNAEKPGQRTPADAKARAAAMFGWLEDIVADDPHLVLPTGQALVQGMEISAYDGPDHEALAPSGFGGYVTATVTCLSEQN